jgi:uncharacterized protein (DUF427 family)
MRAIWNGAVIAESDDTVVVEGNQYFPVDSVRREYLIPSDSHTRCHWKGMASYYHIKVGEKVNRDGAWYYPAPSPAAGVIKDRIAFWHGVKIEKGARPARSVEVPEDASCELVPAGSVGQPGRLSSLLHRLVGR